MCEKILEDWFEYLCER